MLAWTIPAVRAWQAPVDRAATQVASMVDNVTAPAAASPRDILQAGYDVHLCISK
jgi:hypothetical protein